jgi:hypothetical protein
LCTIALFLSLNELLSEGKLPSELLPVGHQSFPLLLVWSALVIV